MKTIIDWVDELLQQDVWVDPGRRGGRPCLKGTRFTVGQLLAELTNTKGAEEVAEAFDLDLNKINNILYRLATLLEEKPLE